MEEFTKRRWGGAALIRLDTKLLEEKRKYKLYAFTRRESWKEIFDIRGSKAIKIAEPNANSFKAWMERWDGYEVGLDAIAKREYRVGQTAQEIDKLKEEKPRNWETRVQIRQAELTESQSILQALTNQRETMDRTPR